MNQDSLEVVLGTVHNLLVAEGMTDAAALVSQYPARAEQTSFDNWNGGTEIWTIYFEVPAVNADRNLTHFAWLSPIEN